MEKILGQKKDAFSKVTQALESEIQIPQEIYLSGTRMGEIDEGKEYDQNALVESLVEEMSGGVSRETIEQAVNTASRKYINATVKNFLSILIRREALKTLK